MRRYKRSRMVGNYQRLVAEGPVRGLRNSDQIRNADNIGGRSTLGRGNAASQLSPMTGDWLVWYAKADGTIHFMPSTYDSLGKAKQVARRLRDEGYQVWMRKGEKA